MENASKALIIAGAILISILLISVGVLVMNAMNPMTEQAQGQSEGMAIKTFNAQFTAHEGSGRSVAQVRSMLNDVNASNAVNADHKVKVKKDNGTAAEPNSITLAAGKKYSVSISGYTGGYVSEITITTDGSTTGT